MSIRKICLEEYAISTCLNFFFYVIFVEKPKQIFAKILMWKCYMKIFHEEKQVCKKNFIHFQFKHKEKDLLLVCFYKNHPYGSDLQDYMEKECNCASIPSKDFCDFCEWVSYPLIFHVYKVCIKRIPKSLKDNVINTHQYYKNLKCEPFFRFNNNSNSFKVLLDNPQGLIIPKIVD